MILLVNQHTVPVFTDVVNAFANAGQDTRLFTGHIEPGNVPVSNAVRIVKSRAYDRTSTFSRFLSWSLFVTHYFFYLVFCKKPAHIIVVTNPPIAPFITSLVARWRNIPFHIVVFDLYPEALQQAGLSSGTGWLFRKWQSNNRWTFRRAASLITLSESMKNAVSQYVDAGKISIIFNWADTSYIRPLEKQSNPFTIKHNMQGKFVVLYSGNMGLTHDLESLVGAAEKLKRASNIIFVFIGGGAKLNKLQSLSAGYDNILFLPYQDATMFPFAMAAADVGIVTLGTGGEGISVPSKTYINMAAGLAIITISPADSELNRIVQHSSIGYAVAPNQPELLADHILFLSSNPSELQKFKTNSREASLNFTSANAKKYVDHLNL
ncbi:MAG: glycosyltransferase family 4 protein [Bacteroidota bacterium]